MWTRGASSKYEDEVLAHAASVITSQSKDFNTLPLALLLSSVHLCSRSFLEWCCSKLVLLQAFWGFFVRQQQGDTWDRPHAEQRDTTSLQQSGLKTSKHISVRHLFRSLSPECSENNQQAGSHPHLTATCVFAKTQVSERKVKEGGGGQVVKSKKQTWPLGQLSWCLKWRKKELFAIIASHQGKPLDNRFPQTWDTTLRSDVERNNLTFHLGLGKAPYCEPDLAWCNIL